MAAFGTPVNFDLSALLAGRPQPMGQAERTKSAVASMPAASASGIMKSTSRKHGGPQLLRAKVAPAARDQGVAIGPRAGAGASFGAAAGLVAPERPEARVEVAKPAPAAAAQAFHAAPADTLLWSALDVPATLPAPAVVPATPFFLGANHRVVLGTQTEALRAAVTALLDIGADVSMSSTGKFCCTVIGHARSELQLQTWSLPAVEGFQTGLVMELRRLAGDRYAFHSTVLAFNLALAAATTAAGLGLASSVSDERVAPLGDRPSAPLGIYSASPPKSTLEEAAAVLSGLARPTSTAAFVAPPVGDAATGAAAEVRDEAAVKAIYMDNYTVIASMLDSRCDDVREEGAQRAVAALLAADSSSAVCPAACRAALRERGLSARLIKALVRTEAGSGCHSQAAMALAQMARCNDCAADMVAFGAVEVLASVIMQPCVRQTVRLRRAAAEALSVLASAADIGEKAVGCGVVGYLRLAATTCPDRTFGEAAERAASAIDPKGRVTAASAGGVDFAAMTNEARQAAYRLASGSV